MMPPHVELIPSGTPDILDLFFRPDVIALKSWDFYRNIPHIQVRAFCHHHARYLLPTKELVEWLRDIIGQRSVIEIGSGHGDLAFWLNIVGTDNFLQTRPEIAAYYRLIGQPTIQYPSWIEKYDALAAIDKHQPQIVVASWVTQLGDATVADSNPYGVPEWEILDRGITYIFIGNSNVHGNKRIMSRTHETHQLPFIVSRAHDPTLNRVWIWRPESS